MIYNVVIRLLVLSGVFSLAADGKSTWEMIKTIPSLRWMARVLESRGLTSLFDAENVTVYLPTSEGFFQFDAAYYGIGDSDTPKWERLFIYGSQNGRVTLSSLPLRGRIQSRLNPSLSLYINTFNTGTKQITTINGATIVHADIITDNGVLHIVDRMIAPVGSRFTIAEYLETPELHDLSFRAIILAAIVVPALTQKTNDSKALHTSFSPNDSYLYPMPEYGKGPLFNNFTILREVYEAHLIEDEAFFIPHSLDKIPTKQALFGNIRFYKRDGKLYIANNRVHARVIQPNIPTVNGVIHVIDNLLRYVYHNALQVVDSIPDAKIFAQLLDGLNSQQQQRLTAGTVTIFIPTDWAFSKVPLYWQSELLRQENQVEQGPLEGVLFGHVIPSVAVDAAHLYDGQKLTMANNKSVTVLQIGEDFYLETADKKIRSKVEVTDIGVTNGVAHLVSNVLFASGFTIWEALSDIPQLKRIRELMTINFPELRATLNLNSPNPITVFLPSNEVLERAAEFVNSMMLLDSQDVFKIIEGHIIPGQFSSSVMVGETQHMTMAGKTIKIIRANGSSTIRVTGGHVTSKIVVRDVFCSNGVLHIIDDLLHTPTRTVDMEMKLRDDIRYMQTLFTRLDDKKYDLGSKASNYTVFVANNDAFSSLPWDTVSELLNRVNWTKQVLRAHVVRNEARTLDRIPSGTGLPAEHNVVYVLKKNGKVFVMNNNMMAEVLVANIPAVNGWIHIIDKILTIPYESVADVMGSRDEVSLFHKLMNVLPEYREIFNSPLRQVTLFVPSTRYINTLTDEQMVRIKGDLEILRKLFYGHVLPNVRLDDVFLRQYPEDDYCSRSTYNVSFKISRGANGMFVGVGFDVLTLDMIGRSFGCSNGIVYVIDGFLNYSPFTVLERLKREPGLSVSFEHMTRLATQNDIDLLDNNDLSFTFMMPDDLALDYFSFSDLLRLHSLPEGDQHRTFWRHSINGSTFLYDDLKNGHMTPDLLPREVSIDIKDEAIFLRYKKINSRIKQWNLIASNGVIHILMQFLYDSSENAPSTSSSSSSSSSLSLSTPPTAKGNGYPTSLATRDGNSGPITQYSSSLMILTQLLLLVALNLR